MEDSSCFVYFPQDLLWQFWALCGIINFRIILSSAVANVTDILIGIALNI